MSTSKGKHILFYSNFCQFSKEVVSIITKKNIRHLFLLVCVDGQRYNIPPFVNRVPMIFTTQKQLYADQGVVAFLEDIEMSMAATTTARDTAAAGGFDVSAYYAPDMDGTITDSFSYIGGEESHHQFAFVGNQPRIETPSEDVYQAHGMKDKDPMKDVMDRIIAERNNDANIRIPNGI